MTHGRLAILASAIAALVLIAASAIPQSAAENAYSDLQQANRILPMLEEIAGIEDPAMRLHLRATILQFVYTQKISDVYPIADAEARRFFDDLAVNRKLFSELRVSLWCSILKEMRVSRPGFAEELERAIVSGSDIARIDIVSLSDKTPPSLLSAIVDRTLGRIRRGEAVSVLRPVIERMQKKDVALSDKLILAALEQDEKQGDANYSILFTFGPQVFPPTESAELKKRYLNVLLSFCRKKAAGKDIDAGRAGQILKKYKESFKLLGNEAYAEAGSLFEIYQAGRSPQLVIAEARYARIEASADPIAEALLEAQKATELNMRDNLIYHAAERAISAKEFRRAVDIIMLRGQSWDQIPYYRDTVLVQRIGQSALEAKNDDAVLYALSKIESPGMRVTLMGELASRKVHEPNMSVQVSSLTQAALKLVETNPITKDSPGQAFRSVYPSFFLGNIEGFDALRRTIAILNNVPAPSSDEKPGGKNYQSYSDSVSLAAASFLGVAFGWTMAREPDVAVFRIQDIEHRPYRIAAQIAIERGRRYVMPVNK